MEDEFYNVLLDLNAQKLDELLELCARFIMKKNFLKKNGPLKPKKVKKGNEISWIANGEIFRSSWIWKNL